jgi:hypothetical protein
MKDFGGKIEYKDKVYKLPFNLNVMEEIQDKYGSIDKWAELTDGSENGEPNVKAVIFGLTSMINEGIEIENEENGTKEKKLTSKQVGRIITEVGLKEALKELNSTVTESTKSDEKNV